jgi:energy-coupling factor transporter ATP-binding protein EcfA2
MEATPMSFMQDSFPKYNVGQLRQHLGKTGIVGTIADTRIKGLSYSQRSCVIFSKLTLESPHLLILDEPTNFLDLESVDSLISACNKYKGALLLVSHNRDFLKKCAKQFLSIVPGRFNLYDDLKTAEKSTYTFIQEMEAGGKISGKTAIMENPGGGSIHSSQKAGATTTTTAATSAAPVAVAAKSAAKPAAVKTETAPAAAAAAPTSVGGFEVNERIQAKFSEDGRWYNAVVRGIKGDLFSVYYVDYGNSEFVPIASLRKLNTTAKAGGAPANKQQTNARNNAPQQRSNNNRLDR